MWKKVVTNLLLTVCFANFSFSQTAQWVVQPKYSSLENFTDRYFKFKENAKSGLLDLSGKEVFPAIYDSITSFTGGYSFALNKETGKFAVKAILDYQGGAVSLVQGQYFLTKYQAFSEGKLPVSDAKGKYGFLLCNGELGIKCVYSEVHPFFDGWASVKLRSPYIVYVNEDGGFMRIEAGNGAIVFGSSFCDGQAVVYTMDRKGYVINTLGRIIREYKLSVEKASIRPSDYRISDASCPVAKAELPEVLTDDAVKPFVMGDKFGFNHGNIIVLPAQFSNAQPFRKGFAVVKKDNKYGVLKFINGGFLLSTDANTLKVKKGNSEPAHFALSVPSGWSQSYLTLKLTPQNGNSEILKPTSVTNGIHYFNYTPVVTNNEREKPYNVTVLSEDGLILNESSGKLKFEYPEPKFAIASFSNQVTADVNGNCVVSITIENQSEESGTIPVSISGGKVKPVNKSLSIAGGSSGKILANINIGDAEKEVVRLNVCIGNTMKSILVEVNGSYRSPIK